MVHYELDIQAFKRYFNRAVVKEVAIVALETDAQPSMFLFKPPFPWKVLCRISKLQQVATGEGFRQLSYHLRKGIREKAMGERTAFR